MEYIDCLSGNKYAVKLAEMGLGYKPVMLASGEKDWHGMENMPIRATYKEAEKDLKAFAKLRGLIKVM